MDNTKWVVCPYCNCKTRVKLLPETVLKCFPLYCPKCKKEVVIEARNQEVEVLATKKKSDTKM